MFVRARSRAPPLPPARPVGAPRRHFCACPLARGAPRGAPKAPPCRCTRPTLAGPEGASVRARSHAALVGAARRRSRACPPVSGPGVPRRRFRARPLARGASWRTPKALSCVPARTRRPRARPEGDSVRARPHAAHPGAPRKPYRGCPLARGAHERAPKAIPCAWRPRAHEFQGSLEPRRPGAWKSRAAAPSSL